MKRIQKFLLPIVLLFFFGQSRAQTISSIIPEISEAYVARLIEVAKNNYPRVKSVQSRLAIAKTNVGRAKASYLDALTFSYVYQPHSASIINTANGATTGGSQNNNISQPYSYFNGIQAGVYFNLGFFLEKPSAVRQAKEELKIATNDQEEYLRSLATDVKKKYYTYVLRLAEVKMQTQTAQDAQEIMKSMRRKFEKGEETYENYNRSQVSYSDRNQAKIASETNMLMARADLEEILGDKIENIK